MHNPTSLKAELLQFSRVSKQVLWHAHHQYSFRPIIHIYAMLFTSIQTHINDQTAASLRLQLLLARG